jgi:hypothetical protein
VRLLDLLVVAGRPFSAVQAGAKSTTRKWDQPLLAALAQTPAVITQEESKIAGRSQSRHAGYNGPHEPGDAARILSQPAGRESGSMEAVEARSVFGVSKVSPKGEHKPVAKTAVTH